jgi:hypothetical protein
MKIRLERCAGYLSPGSQARSPLTSASPVTRDKLRGQRGLLAQYLRCSRLAPPHLLMEGSVADVLILSPRGRMVVSSERFTPAASCDLR